MTDLYLKSLKEFKPTPAKSSDSEGQVKTWSAPAAPPAPEAAANVASELSAYESAEVESASADGTAKSTSENEGDWFELDTSPDRESLTDEGIAVATELIRDRRPPLSMSSSFRQRPIIKFMLYKTGTRCPHIHCFV